MKKLSLSLAVAAIASLATVANAALADGGAKFLGNITTGGQIRSDFAQYWNQITTEKVLRQNLKGDKAQMDLIDRMLDEVSTDK